MEPKQEAFFKMFWKSTPEAEFFDDDVIRVVLLQLQK